MYAKIIVRPEIIKQLIIEHIEKKGHKIDGPVHFKIVESVDYHTDEITGHTFGGAEVSAILDEKDKS